MDLSKVDLHVASRREEAEEELRMLRLEVEDIG